ncbi:hypothetical protein [Wolbachia endosymbiont (group B) of Dolichovespula media]|uniref:hypothetical protein n=1 Tax=Wolbachia endosymbiont (group B) of Dolichovespula media TaxID=2954001 RepID=UPI0021F849E0|nr:hypothetical protein [Wolbachia endosymbiont (group B) of Dolichovespula media]
MLLTDRQKKIRDSLISEAIKGNFENIKNNHDSDIQEVLKNELPSNIQEEFKGDLPNPCTTSQFIIFQKNQKEINQCIQKMEQKIESISCDIAIQEAKGSDDSHMQKVKNLKRISDLHHKLRQTIDYLDVKKVKAVLEDCDTNLAMILNRPIHSQSKTTLLLYPLQVGLNKRYIGDGKRLKQEDLRNIKEITKLLWNKASPEIRDFWFKFHQDQQEESTKDTKATFEAHLKKASPDIRDLWLKYQRVPENQDAAVIKLLKGEQQRHAKIGSEKWLEDFIQEVKDYKEQKSIKENCEIAIEKPITKCVLQNAQLSKVSTNRACYIS